MSLFKRRKATLLLTFSIQLTAIILSFFVPPLFRNSPSCPNSALQEPHQLAKKVINVGFPSKFDLVTFFPRIGVAFIKIFFISFERVRELAVAELVIVKIQVVLNISKNKRYLSLMILLSLVLPVRLSVFSFLYFNIFVGKSSLFCLNKSS